MAWFSDEGKQPPMTDYIIHVNPILTVKGKKTDYIIVKPVYKGHSREPENVAFMSRCPLHTG
jgi:hypothetical protein